MKLKDIGDVGNMVAALGVIISLLFVGYQINENTVETRATNRQASADAIREVALSFATDSSLATAIATIRAGDAYDDAQALQYSGFLVALLKSIEEEYLQYKDGRLDETYKQARASSAITHLQFTYPRDFYQELKTGRVLTPEFGTWMDEQLADRLDE